MYTAAKAKYESNKHTQVSDNIFGRIENEINKAISRGHMNCMFTLPLGDVSKRKIKEHLQTWGYDVEIDGDIWTLDWSKVGEW
ncbi:MAG TPA: hypothetical protein DCW90_09665 [Lachnospiraceae bacterium]|nr:hypothetical protein [Lachnospiraceae bacterium]